MELLLPNSVSGYSPLHLPSTLSFTNATVALGNTMPVGALQRVSQGQNGVGSFILQCKRLSFHYCDWAGSSRGMNYFIKSLLPAFARANPQVEIEVSPRPSKHPIIRGQYINGQERVICVKNLEMKQILRKAEVLRDGSGEKLKKVNKPVKSINESVRGIWSPFHSRENNWKV